MNVITRKRWRTAINLLLLVAVVTVPSFADDEEERGKIWLTPFGGYRLSGSLQLNEDPNYSKLNIADHSVYGFAVGAEVVQGLVEVMWTHQDTVMQGVPIGGGAPVELFNMNVDQIHLNGLYFPPGFEEGRTQPFVLGGIGATMFDPSGDSIGTTKFSWALGGGIHTRFTKHLGLRLEGKWNPALVSSSGGTFCSSSSGRCFVSASGELIDQFDFTAGLTLRL